MAWKFNPFTGNLDYYETSSTTTVTDASISFSDITTNDFSTSKHGFVPKGTNVGNFLKDDGTWAATSGSGLTSPQILARTCGS